MTEKKKKKQTSEDDLYGFFLGVPSLKPFLVGRVLFVSCVVILITFRSLEFGRGHLLLQAKRGVEPIHHHSVDITLAPHALEPATVASLHGGNYGYGGVGHGGGEGSRTHLRRTQRVVEAHDAQQGCANGFQSVQTQARTQNTHKRVGFVSVFVVSFLFSISAILLCFVLFFVVSPVFTGGWRCRGQWGWGNWDRKDRSARGASREATYTTKNT